MLIPLSAIQELLLEDTVGFERQGRTESGVFFGWVARSAESPAMAEKLDSIAGVFEHLRCILRFLGGGSSWFLLTPVDVSIISRDAIGMEKRTFFLDLMSDMTANWRESNGIVVRRVMGTN
mmetsp:Transcript_46786/g.69580  ORF Transcript_46786/g.69580 Transcript_46786/m.69580 type:complete len:121 (+) Transcript_46786:151-513(+)